MTTSDVLKQILETCGLERRGLAERLGISKSYADALFAGQREPGPRLAARIGDMLGMDAVWRAGGYEYRARGGGP